MNHTAHARRRTALNFLAIFRRRPPMRHEPMASMPHATVDGHCGALARGTAHPRRPVVNPPDVCAPTHGNSQCSIYAHDLVRDPRLPLGLACRPRQTFLSSRLSAPAQISAQSRPQPRTRARDKGTATRAPPRHTTLRMAATQPPREGPGPGTDLRECGAALFCHNPCAHCPPMAAC